MDREANYTLKSSDQRNVIKLNIEAQEKDTKEHLKSELVLFEILIGDRNDNGPEIKTDKRTREFFYGDPNLGFAFSTPILAKVLYAKYRRLPNKTSLLKYCNT